MYDLPKWLEEPSARDALKGALAGGDAILREVKIKVTSRCNLRCQMCRYWKTKREEALSLEEWCGVLDELPGLGCRKIHVSGGVASPCVLSRSFVASITRPPS